MATAPTSNETRPPRIAAGAELLGEYEDSGLKDAPYLIKSPDGQVVQLPHLLYLVAECADGRRSHHEIAEEVSRAVGRGLSGDDVRYLVEEKLTPLGVMDGERRPASPIASDPLLALRFRMGMVPERAVHAIGGTLRPLFWPPVLIAILAAFAAFDAWLFLSHGVAQPVRSVVHQPLLALLVFGLLIACTAFHEFGHATACRYGGGRPGRMGVGIYVVWPAFYTDVTDAYRLGRWARVRTDLGGLYFNAVFIIAEAAVYLVTGYEPILVAVVVQHLLMLQQLLPFLRFDGYYAIADIAGVPDLFDRIRPILRGILPGRRPEPGVEQLRGWVRTLVTAWVVLTVPFVGWVYAMLLVNLPRIVATGYESFRDRSAELSAAFADGDVAAGTLRVIQMMFLVVPVAGVIATLGRTGVRAGAGVWRRTDGRPLARSVVALVLLCALTFAVLALTMRERYRPISPDERGTIAESTFAVARAAARRQEPSPRPSRSPSPSASPSLSPPPSPDAVRDAPAGVPTRTPFETATPEPLPTASPSSPAPTQEVQP